MVKKIIFPTFLLLALVGCGENKSNNTVESETAASQVTEEASVPQTANASAVENSPIELVLGKVKDFQDFRILDIRQEFNTPESGKTEAKVILTREGIADDSVSAERTTYEFKFDQGQWKEVSHEDSWRCGRGSDTKTFHTTLCP